MAFKIETITAFVAIGDDGDEGIIGMNTPNGWIPLIGADEARIRSLAPMARQIAAMSGKSLKMLKFTNRVDVTESMT